MNTLADLAAITPQKIWDGVLGRVVYGEHVTLGVVELAPDTLIPEHRHENEQAGLLIAGSLTFRVGDEIREFRAGGTWRVPPNVPHEVQAGGDGAIVVEAFAPPRADWETLEYLAACQPIWPA